MNNGYVAALDVGDVRIGVAIASLIAKLPSAYTTLDRKTQPNILEWLVDFVKKESIQLLVVGLPRDMSGQETEQTKKIKEFVKEIENFIDIPIIMQDEAVTSIEAENRLKASGKPYEKADIDAEAACIILQDYLSSEVGQTA